MLYNHIHLQEIFPRHMYGDSCWTRVVLYIYIYIYNVHAKKSCTCIGAISGLTKTLILDLLERRYNGNEEIYKSLPCRQCYTPQLLNSPHTTILL